MYGRPTLDAAFGAPFSGLHPAARGGVRCSALTITESYQIRNSLAIGEIRTGAFFLKCPRRTAGGPGLPTELTQLITVDCPSTTEPSAKAAFRAKLSDPASADFQQLRRLIHGQNVVGCHCAHAPKYTNCGRECNRKALAVVPCRAWVGPCGWSRPALSHGGIGTRTPVISPTPTTTEPRGRLVASRAYHLAV